MKVSDLKEILKDMPDNAQVVVQVFDSGYGGHEIIPYPKIEHKENTKLLYERGGYWYEEYEECGDESSILIINYTET